MQQPQYHRVRGSTCLDLAGIRWLLGLRQRDDEGRLPCLHHHVVCPSPHACDQAPTLCHCWQASKDKLLQRPGPTTFVKIPELAVPCAAAAADPGAAELDAEGPCLLRKEPNEAALCTYEAIARYVDAGARRARTPDRRGSVPVEVRNAGAPAMLARTMQAVRATPTSS